MLAAPAFAPSGAVVGVLEAVNKVADDDGGDDLAVTANATLEVRDRRGGPARFLDVAPFTDADSAAALAVGRAAALVLDAGPRSSGGAAASPRASRSAMDLLERIHSRRVELLAPAAPAPASPDAPAIDHRYERTPRMRRRSLPARADSTSVENKMFTGQRILLHDLRIKWSCKTQISFCAKDGRVFEFPAAAATAPSPRPSGLTPLADAAVRRMVNGRVLAFPPPTTAPTPKPAPKPPPRDPTYDLPTAAALGRKRTTRKSHPDTGPIETRHSDVAASVSVPRPPGPKVVRKRPPFTRTEAPL